MDILELVLILRGVVCIMGKLLGLIAVILGRVLNWTYENISFHNYGLAIIIFTVMVRLMLIPMMIKEHKANKKMNIIKPKLDELKNRCGNDIQKYNMEVSRVYQEEGINPAAGCLPALLNLLVTCQLFYAISKPLTYMKGMTAEEIAKLISLVPPEKRITGMYEQIAAVAHNKLLNTNFLGMDLASIPEYNWVGVGFLHIPVPQFNWLLILPILAAVTTYLPIRFGMRNTSVDKETREKTGSFVWVFTIITLLFSFKVPASLSVYWITGNLIQILQQWYLNKCIKDDDEIHVGTVVD